MARKKRKKLPKKLKPKTEKWFKPGLILFFIAAILAFAVNARLEIFGFSPVEIFSAVTSSLGRDCDNKNCQNPGSIICAKWTTPSLCKNNIAIHCSSFGFVQRENCTRQGKICTVFMGVDAMCVDDPKANNIECDPRDHPSRCKGNVLEKCINRRWNEEGAINCNMGDGGVGGICIDYGNKAECSANPNSPPPPPSAPAGPASPAPANCSYVCLFNNKCAMLGGTQVSGACANGRICCSVDDDNTLPPPPSQPQSPTPSACSGDCVSGWKCTLFGGTKINGTCSSGVCCAGL